MHIIASDLAVTIRVHDLGFFDELENIEYKILFVGIGSFPPSLQSGWARSTCYIERERLRERKGRSPHWVEAHVEGGRSWGIEADYDDSSKAGASSSVHISFTHQAHTNMNKLCLYR